MRIRKTHDVPVVHELVKTPSGGDSPASRAGVPRTAMLVGVEGERTLHLGYDEAIGRCVDAPEWESAEEKHVWLLVCVQGMQL